MVLRHCKIALIAVIAVFFSLVVFNNTADYGTNLVFVQHVLSMDTTFPTPNTQWRSIESPYLQTVGFISIVSWQALTALFCWIATIQLFRSRDNATAFTYQKKWAYIGLTLGFTLYAFGFMTIANEWFLMWQSVQWNGASSAMRFITMIGFTFVIMLTPE